jgi:putative membrane protein
MKKPKMKKNKQQAKTTKENTRFILLFLKGALMGLFDLVPGVSGGTMALITGIYEKLIMEINNAFDFLKKIFLFNKKNINNSWKQIDKTFLMLLIPGIITGIIISVIGLSYLLNNYFTEVMGAITGIILVASILLVSKIKTTKNYLIGLIGLTIGIILSILTPSAGHEFNYLQVFFLGLIAINAMILPGISGALILLLLGGYDFMINALKNVTTNYYVVGIFILGAMFGLAIFTRTINKLLKKKHDETMSFLSFLMLGAVTKPVLEILKTNNPENAIIFFVIAGIVTYFLFRK